MSCFSCSILRLGWECLERALWECQPGWYGSAWNAPSAGVATSSGGVLSQQGAADHLCITVLMKHQRDYDGLHARAGPRWVAQLLGSSTPHRSQRWLPTRGARQYLPSSCSTSSGWNKPRLPCR